MSFGLLAYFFVLAHAGLEFKADFYERNLENDTVQGKGHAWIQTETREVWADTIEIDFKANRAIARGNVRVKDAETDISTDSINYTLDGKETILENAVVVATQMVLQGTSIIRQGKNHYEISEGSYTNCNLLQLPPKEAVQCAYAWRIYGRRFSIDVGEYAHITDALVLINEQPLFYLPYLVVPVKTSRQSGFLLPTFSSHAVRGQGVSIPYYWALSPWQDLESIPIWNSKTGLDLALNYRYLITPTFLGNVKLKFLRRQFGATPLREDDIGNNPLSPGGFGEWGLFTKHETRLNEFSRVLIDVRRVSNALFTVDYAADIDSQKDLASLRSQVSYEHFGDFTSFGVAAIDHQSLIFSRSTETFGGSDGGSDGGPVGQFPSLYLSQRARPFWGRLISYEIDTEWSNFYRLGNGFDNLPSTPTNTGPNTDEDPNWDANDYVRTGQRLMIEPRLTLTPFLPDGLQFQPKWNVGLLGYLFGIPSQSSYLRYFSAIELPFSIYLSRVIRTSGTSAYSHVFQPRVVYAKNLFHNPLPSHRFFEGITSQPTDVNRPPLFDSRDLISPYEYVRFEIINRLRKRDHSGNSNRVLTFSVSEQFNIRSAKNEPLLKNSPLYEKERGPLDFLADFSLGHFSGQIQAKVQLEPTLRGEDNIFENEWSSGIRYDITGRDYISVSSRFTTRADEASSDQSTIVTFLKSFASLPDLEGAFEYSIKRRSPVRYAVGVSFQTKPASCWGVKLRFGEENMGNPTLKTFYSNLSFRMDFGSPGRMLRSDQ